MEVDISGRNFLSDPLITGVHAVVLIWISLTEKKNSEAFHPKILRRPLTKRSIKVADRFDCTWTAKLALCAKCIRMVGPEERKSPVIRFETAYKNNARSINQSIHPVFIKADWDIYYYNIETITQEKMVSWSLYSAAKCWCVPTESLSRRVVKTDYIQTAKHGLIEAHPHYITGILRYSAS